MQISSIVMRAREKAQCTVIISKVEYLARDVVSWRQACRIFSGIKVARAKSVHRFCSCSKVIDMADSEIYTLTDEQ